MCFVVLFSVVFIVDVVVADGRVSILSNYVRRVQPNIVFAGLDFSSRTLLLKLHQVDLGFSMAVEAYK